MSEVWYKNKKIVYYALLLLLVLGFSVLVLNYFSGGGKNYNSHHYEQMTGFHFRQDQNLPPGLIYFIGDSHTQGLATQAITEKSVNYGIGADTTVGVIRRLGQYQSIKNAKAVVIAIGFNDMKSKDNSFVLHNIELIIQSIQPDIPIFISKLLPVSRNRFHSDFIARIISLNTDISTLCDKQPDVHCIDVFKQLSDKKNSLREIFHIGDGVHLNKDGYALWINEIKTSLNNNKLINE